MAIKKKKNQNNELSENIEKDYDFSESDFDID